MPRNFNNQSRSANGSRKFTVVLTIISFIAAVLLPIGVTTAAQASSSPWNQDSIYGCVEQPIDPFAVMPGAEPGEEAFRLRDGRLPDGLELDTKTGIISGTPRAIYRDNFVISSPINPDYPDQRFSALIDDRCRPTVDRIEPSRGTNLGGTEITITGSGFDELATVEVDDAGTAIYLKDVKAEKDRIMAVMPAFSGSGPVTLIIRNPDGSRYIGKDAFTYEGGPVTPTMFTQPLIDGVPSFGTMIVGQPIADDRHHPELGKVIRTDGTAGVFEITSDPLIPDLAIIVTNNRLTGDSTSAVVGTPTASGPYAFTITSRVEGADPDRYSFEFTGQVRYSVAHTVTFNGNGATSGSMFAQNSDIKTQLTTNAFARTGYTFNGWSTNAGGGGSIYTDNGLYEFAANITLYAQWVAIPPVAHTVTFNGNGATAGTMAIQTSSAAAALNPNGFTRSGYEFDYWSTTANGSGTIYNNGAIYGFAQDVTLYALWKLPVPTGGDTGVFHTVSYDGNGATSGSTTSQTNRSPAAVRANGFIRPGYVFVHWNSSANHDGFELSPGEVYNFGADVTLYAEWNKIPDAAVTITVEKPLSIHLLVGDTRTVLVNVASSEGALVPIEVDLPAGLLTQEADVRITPRVTGSSFAAGLITIQIDLIDSNGKDVSSLSAVLTVRFSGKLGSGMVAKSDDGLTWVSIPMLSGTTLPATQADGYYLDEDGQAVILTRHLTDFGYKKAQASLPSVTLVSSSLQVGATTALRVKGGSGNGSLTYKSNTPLFCSVSSAGSVRGLKVGSCDIQITRLGDESYVQANAKLVKLNVIPGLIPLEFKIAYNGVRQIVIGATKVQLELGPVNGLKTVGVEISEKSNGIYRVIGQVKLSKTGSATYVRTIAIGTTIRIRYAGRTISTFKLLPTK
jgi:uncharacterized repeat protein (TIGR02543 family)